MSAPLNASLPPFLTLAGGMTVRVTALDPTSGATLTTVKVSGVSLSVDLEDTVETDTTPLLGPQTLLPGPALVTCPGRRRPFRFRRCLAARLKRRPLHPPARGRSRAA